MATQKPPGFDNLVISGSASSSLHSDMDKLIHLILLSGLVSIAGGLEENFALKGTATQSSTLLNWVAQKAVDGVRYGSVEADHCSTTPVVSNPWWRLDLLDYYEIDTVIIAPKPSCCPEFTTGVEIRIGDSLDNNGNNNPICAVTSGITIHVPVSYSCGAMDGRYVNLAMPGQTTHLTICEVEVYGKFLGQRKRTFLRLKMSSSGDVAAESDKILHQVLVLNIFNLDTN
ncbi:putative fucolectin-like [Triplophysa rosa]|uniref:Fucolectin-like n=1 Tax=Triplophysa rosa TaxID=992332 RepID=A0A9W7W7T6_TRIRA|nr:putative fucolectin-like [Triplophysa rosa]